MLANCPAHGFYGLVRSDCRCRSRPGPRSQQSDEGRGSNTVQIGRAKAMVYAGVRRERLFMCMCGKENSGSLYRSVKSTTPPSLSSKLMRTGSTCTLRPGFSLRLATYQVRRASRKDWRYNGELLPLLMPHLIEEAAMHIDITEYLPA